MRTSLLSPKVEPNFTWCICAPEVCVMRMWSFLLFLSACAAEEERSSAWANDVVCQATEGVVAGYDVDDVVPEFELLDQHGDATRLSDFCHNVVLVEVSSFF
jgi:hypothetical protein